MYLFRNALKNLFRNKGRYLLVGGIMTVMLAAVTVLAMINATTKEIVGDYVDRFSVRVYFTQNSRRVLDFLTPDENKMIQMPELSTEEYLRFAESEYLAKTMLTGEMSAFSDELEGLDQQGSENAPVNPYLPEHHAANCAVFGYSDLSLIEEFNVGQREISGGRIFEDLGECVVSEEFAELNNLSVGDEITVLNVLDEAHMLTLTVSGMYLDLTTAQPYASSPAAVSNRRNEILTSYETLTASGIDNIFTKAEYYLKNPELAEAFEAELREKGLSELYIVNVDADAYTQIVEPVKGLSRISNVMMVVVLVFGGGVLILLSVLSVRERKYEIGVLRAMGMEKKKVTAGMLIETFAVIALCLVFGLGVGITVAQPVSNNILSEQIAIAQKNFTPNEADWGGFISGLPTKDTVDYSALNNVEVRVTPDVLAMTVPLALLLGLLSNSVGILYITRFEPIRILSERD